MLAACCLQVTGKTPGQVNVASCKSLDDVTLLMGSLSERWKRTIVRVLLKTHMLACPHDACRRKQHKKTRDLTELYDQSMETFREDTAFP